MLPWPVRARNSHRLDTSAIGSFSFFFFFLRPGGPTFLPPPNSLENRPTGHPRIGKMKKEKNAKRKADRTVFLFAFFLLHFALSANSSALAIVDNPGHLSPQVLPMDDPVDESVLQEELA